MTGSGSARLYDAIYETALANGMPMDLVSTLIRIFAFDVDYQRRVEGGDSIEVLYGLEADGVTPTGEILYASITVGGSTRHFYRYQTADGETGYFDEEGESARKFLLRRPVTQGTFRSGFGRRRHPILGYTRAHNGVDWSAPRGTPIMAAADGVIEEAQWRSGYGRWIKIRHANGYETGYAHQTNFARGIAPGVRVRQGQVIGYVGSTGLSTGPHLHFEVFVNGRHVDPMRIRVGRDRTLEGDDLVSFQRERERIDEIMARDRGPSVRMAGG